MSDAREVFRMLTPGPGVGAILAVLGLLGTGMFLSTRESDEARWLGMEVEPLTPSLRQALRLPSEQPGVFVSDVVGLARDSGVKEGDVIVRVNERTIEGMTSFVEAKRLSDAVTGVTLTVNRQGSLVTVPVALGPTLYPGQTAAQL
jgi:serine protease Do